MIAGHFGFAALVKGQVKQAPLWALMLATVWIDIVFIPLFLMNAETLVPAPGLRGRYGENIIHADYTHSLLGAILLAGLLGALCAIPWGQVCGVTVSVVSFSHWMLDLLVHRQDLPLLPGNAGNLPRLGFGLWRMPEVAVILEALLVAAGAWAYWRAASGVCRASGQSLARAGLAAGMIFVCGNLVLILDVTAH